MVRGSSNGNSSAMDWSSNQPQQAYDHVDVDIARRSHPILHLDAKHDGILYRIKLEHSVGVRLGGNKTKRPALRLPLDLNHTC